MGFALDLDLAVVPVDVFELQVGDFSGPQPEPDQQLQDGKVPPPGHALTVTGGQQVRRLRGRNRAGQPGQSPHGRRRHAALSGTGVIPSRNRNRKKARIPVVVDDAEPGERREHVAVTKDDTVAAVREPSSSSPTTGSPPRNSAATPR